MNIATRTKIADALTEYVQSFDFAQFESFYGARDAVYRTADSARDVAYSMIPTLVDSLATSEEQYPHGYCASAHLQFFVMVQNNEGQKQLRMQIEWVAHACGTRWVDI
jgi:hypothetical protein